MEIFIGDNAGQLVVIKYRQSLVMSSRVLLTMTQKCMIYSALPRLLRSRNEASQGNLPQGSSACEFIAILLTIFVRPMNVPTHFHDPWRGQRENSFKRMLRNEFAARVCKTGLRLDFTCLNRDANVAVGDSTRPDTQRWPARAGSIQSQSFGLAYRAYPVKE
jgi:hypothetical protein